MSTAGMPADMDRMWGGRFGGGPTPEMDRLNRSLPVDRRLWRQDVAGSQAWVVALAQAGVLTEAEERELRKGLHRVGAQLEAWTDADWQSAPDEDVHSLVERLLRAEIGDVAGKLHTGRSRNDQVATDFRLCGLSSIYGIDRELRRLQQALVEQAERHVETVMPSYTHMQRAQPVSAAHWLLSHFWPLERDRQRLADIRRRVSVLPLGSGAIAGCAFPVDRVMLKEVLGFRAVSENSMDAVADRDWVAELLFAESLVGVHLSKLAEDVVLFASAEFRMLRLSDGYSTGSSLMPHKRNPDAMELARGKAGALLGELVGLMTVLKGLPSGYNKDLQEDKAPFFRAIDTLHALLPAVSGTIESLAIDADRCAAAVDALMLTTDLAEALVEEGVPFRQAHERVGRLVRAAEERGCALPELPDDVLVDTLGVAVAGRLDTVLDPRASLERRDAPGGTAPVAVRQQLRQAQARLARPA